MFFSQYTRYLKHSMNNIRISIAIIALFSAFLFVGCKEIGPEINFKPKYEGDTSYLTSSVPVAQEKVVYLEEFTGVQCVNCSQGHQLVADLLVLHGERLAAV
ncbi:MAG: hypothetical protein RI894_1144, partial [Bacteroidota bacterium]